MLFLLQEGLRLVAQIDRNFVRARPWKVWPRLLAYALFEGRPLTTRGRWINPLVFAAYRLWSWLPLANRAPDPVFILGLGRSGTTVLGTILALHRDVGYLNEPKALWHAALGDDDLIGSYSRAPGRYRMSAADATPGPSRRLRRYYSAFLGLSRCRRVVDKYPELLFRLGLVDAVFPGARKIVLLRNGADTCQSIEAWSVRNGRGARDECRDWWGRDRRKWRLLVEQLIAPDPYFADTLAEIRALDRHVDMAAVEWIATMREAQRLQDRGDGSVLFVRYEELSSCPRKVIGEILAFCGFSPDETVMAYAQSVLRPRAAYPPLLLNPAIQPAFDATMATWGYQGRVCQ